MPQGTACGWCSSLAFRRSGGALVGLLSREWGHPETPLPHGPQTWPPSLHRESHSEPGCGVLPLAPPPASQWPRRPAASAPCLRGAGPPRGERTPGCHSGKQVQPAWFRCPAPGRLGVQAFSAWVAAGSAHVQRALCLLSGRVGLWKDIFTVSMNEKFDLVYKQKMGKCDLTFDFYL